MMKYFLRTILAIGIVLILGITTLFLYLNDARLRALVLPQIEQSLGRNVQLEHIRFTLFRTFPNAGLVLEGFSIPDPDHQLISFDELVVSVQLWPLLDRQIIVNSLEVTGALAAYHVFEDGSTSLDFLFDASEPDAVDTKATATIDLQHIKVNNALLRYSDSQSGVFFELKGVDATMSLALAETIRSDMEIRIAGLNYSSDATTWLADLPLSLDQSIELDLTNEQFTMNRGALRIRGLELELGGSISNWSADTMNLDLTFNSSSDNFATLLALIPETYQSNLEGIETRGALTLNGSVTGELGKTTTPDFSFVLGVLDGYLKHPDAGKPIENVQIDLTANNDIVTITRFTANADVNLIDIKGTVTHPLDNQASEFDLMANLRIDLSTVQAFYPIDPDTMTLQGQFVFDGAAIGKLSDPENATVSGILQLTNGALFHSSLPHPIEQILVDTRLSATELTITRIFLKSGSNTLESSGRVRNYLRGEPELDVNLKTSLILAELDQYYDLDATGLTLSGTTTADLNLRGPLNDFNAIRFNGSATVNNVTILGDSLPAPVTNMNGTLNFSNNDVQLSRYTMTLGESDFALEGRLLDWKNLFEPVGSVPPARLTATYRAKKLNVDEFVDWEEENEDPLIIELPNLISQLNARMDTLQIMNIPVTNVVGEGQSDPKNLRITSATAQLLGGSAKGRFDWNIYQPDYTIFHFIGTLDNLRAEDFFNVFQMGGKSSFASYITGGFNAQVDYQSGLGSNWVQDAPTIKGNGTFGITRARLQNHPTQKALAALLSMPEFNDLSMDTWNAGFTINDGVLTLTDMNLTSRNAGLTINGTQNLVSGSIDYKLRLRLPEQYATRLTSLVPSDVVDALKQDGGVILLPMLVKGTTDNPVVTLDSDVVQSLITEYLRKRGTQQVEDAARRLLRGIRGN
jgi:hypothetical protein